MKSRTLPLALLLAGACATDPTASRIDDRALHTPIAGGLALDATITPSTLALGDTALIAVTLTNTADTTVTLRFPSGCQLHYVVEEAGGEAAPEEGGGYACTGALTTLSLAPGAAERHEFQWTHTEYTFPPYARALQPAGRYRVSPVLLVGPDGRGPHRGEPVPFSVIDTATYGAKPEVAISVEPARDRVRAGDTVSVWVRLDNQGASTARMQFTSTCHVRLAVFGDPWSPDAVPASTSGDACGDAITSLTIAPRQARLERIVWRAVDRRGAPLAPDVYMLVGSLGVSAPERILTAPVKFVRVEP